MTPPLALPPHAASPPTMRAAVVSAPGVVEIRQVALRPPAPGEVRIRIESCGVCASNVPPWEGRPWFLYPLAPGALGHEAAGTIDAVGAEVTGWQPGDRVAFLSEHGYAEYDFAPAEALVRLTEEGLPWPGEPLGCAINIFRRSGIQAGDTVAVVGVGFLGALLIQLAVKAGAKVIAVARRPFALEIAHRLGATAVPLSEDRSVVVRRVEKLAGGRLPDVVIEATGEQSPLDLAGELTRTRGRLVIAGYHQDGRRSINLQLWNWRGLDVINAHERDPQVYLEGIREALQAVRDGDLDPGPLITHHLPLEELGAALALTRDRPAGFFKAVITL